MRKTIFVAVVFLAVMPAMAQAPTSPQAPRASDRVASMLGNLIFQFEQQADVVNDLTKQLAAERETVKKLTDELARERDKAPKK